LVDQYFPATHGRLAHSKGKEAKLKKYAGGTLFVNHSTAQYIHRKHHVLLRVSEPLRAKNDFELWAKEDCHDIMHYHDNGEPFQAEEFVRHCTNKCQKIDYSGVGAHNQNGVA
jgi:hypothetical protein